MLVQTALIWLSAFTRPEASPVGQLQAASTQQKSWVIRLRPDEDPDTEIKNFLKKNQIQAAAVMTAVGSLKEAQIRLANQNESTLIKGPLEVVSWVGTGSSESTHFHLSVSDSTGKTIGGHLMPGSKVFTTLEIVLIEFSDLEFKRSLEPKSGYKELVIQKK